MRGWSAAEASAVKYANKVLAIKADMRSGQVSCWSVLVNVASDILFYNHGLPDKSHRPLDRNRSQSRRVTGQSVGKFAGSSRVWVYLLRIASGSGPKK